MAAGGHALGRLGRGEAGADRKAAAQRLGQGDHVRLRPRVLVGEQLACAPEAALDLVVDQQDPVLGAEPPKRAQIGILRRPRPALSLDRLDQDGRGRRPDGRLHRLDVSERQVDIARQVGTEAVGVAGVPGGVDRGIGPPVEGAVEADHLDPLGGPVGVVVFARQLQRQLDRLGPRIGEEGHVGETGLGQPRRQRLLARDAEDVGHVPELLALVLQRLHEPRVGVAERIDRDPGQAIEVGLALGREQSHALAALEGERGAAVDPHDVVGRNGDGGRRLGHALPPKANSPRTGGQGTREAAF